MYLKYKRGNTFGLFYANKLESSDEEGHIGKKAEKLYKYKIISHLLGGSPLNAYNP